MGQREVMISTYKRGYKDNKSDKVTGKQGAAMAAAAAVAASQDGRPAKQRKVGPGDGLPGGMFPGGG